MREFVRAAGLVVAVLAASLALRFLLVEPPEFAWTCQAAAPPWWCPLRMAAIVGLRAGLLGVVALVLGLWALWRERRRVAHVALALGVAGLVLYAPEAASGGVLLAALTLVRGTRPVAAA